jgi:hypothetical protein
MINTFTQRYDNRNANSMWQLKNKLLTHETLMTGAKSDTNRHE